MAGIGRQGQGSQQQRHAAPLTAQESARVADLENTKLKMREIAEGRESGPPKNYDQTRQDAVSALSGRVNGEEQIPE